MDYLNNDNPTPQTSVKEHFERVGAGVLAGMAMLVSVELSLEHAYGDHHDTKSDHSSVTGGGMAMARGEGKGETARLPEEFDIGLQTPDISGI